MYHLDGTEAVDDGLAVPVQLKEPRNSVTKSLKKTLRKLSFRRSNSSPDMCEDMSQSRSIVKKLSSFRRVSPAGDDHYPAVRKYSSARSRGSSRERQMIEDPETPTGSWAHPVEALRSMASMPHRHGASCACTSCDSRTVAKASEKTTTHKVNRKVQAVKEKWLQLKNGKKALPSPERPRGSFREPWWRKVLRTSINVMCPYIYVGKQGSAYCLPVA